MDRNLALGAQRRRLILERLREDGVVRTAALAEVFSVSPMTIRNDLESLARRGSLVRVHGGAMAREQMAAEPSYSDKATRNLPEKQRIGHRAARLIGEGMAVFIGNGTTTIEIVRALEGSPPSNVKIFTNALTHATELSRIPQAEIYVVGGYLRGVSYAMVGRLARGALGGVYFDLAFLGANGVSVDHGVTIPSLEEAETAAEVVQRAQRVVIVADHTKFGIVTHGKIADLAGVDTVVTDKGIEPRYRKLLAELDVELVVA